MKTIKEIREQFIDKISWWQDLLFANLQNPGMFDQKQTTPEYITEKLFNDIEVGGEVTEKYDSKKDYGIFSQVIFRDGFITRPLTLRDLIEEGRER